jgi:hypothetical protein
MDWKDYENEIFTHFKVQYPNAEITQNVMIKGRFSKVERQIDILIEDYIAGNRIRIVVDGKFFSQKIDVKSVEMFIGMLNDCEANKGLLITQEGYSQAAINRAYHDVIDIELDILNFKDLQQLQGYGGIVHSGNHGAILPAPFGWIIDGSQRNNMLATFYQRGLTFEQAVENKEFIYVNIYHKDNEIKDLDSFIEFQKEYTIKDFPNAKVKYLTTIKRNDTNVKLREIDIDTYPTKEYTGFVEFDDFILFCVLFTPEELRKKNIKKLENILMSALPLNVHYENRNK